VGSPVWVTGGLAAVIVVLEGVQHLYQFQEQWITYRSTAEALTRERYLYLARASPYVGEDRQPASPSASYAGATWMACEPCA
jgi:Protein of unknown function (DUF4231)